MVLVDRKGAFPGPFRYAARSSTGGGVARRVMAVALWLTGLAGPALSNDSTAVLAADGIRLMPTAGVGLVSEELYISPKRIRVRYVFRALYDGQRSIVAFPLPLLPFSEPEANIVIPGRDPLRDPVDFRLRVDGRPVKAHLQDRAVLNGVDFTPLLSRYGIRPLLILDLDALMRKLRSLPAAALKELQKAGLIEKTDVSAEPQGPQWEAHWDVEVLYWWRQTFPAERKTIVDHAYAPIAGSFFFVLPVEPWVKTTYCTDRAFLRAAGRKMRRHAGERDRPSALIGTEVHYILRTANNWAGKIGRFRLVIDKMKPDDLVSLCWTGLRRVSPTRFVFEARDFVPKGDLKVLFLQDLPQ